jgi:HEAT repeat protein
LFFLSRQGDSYQLLDPYFGVFPASRLKSGGYRPGIAGLEADLITGLRDTDTKRLLTNIELIGALGHVESVSPLLDLLANNSNKMVRGAIYATLLRLHDYGKLRESLDLVEGPAEDSADLATREQILDLVSEIHDPTTLQVLVGFSRSHSDRLRECVIHALRGIGAAQAVPIFVDALDDPVQMIRYDAVLGLATVVRDWSLAPSVEAFAANERKYIEAWKAWWVNSGRKTYRRAGSSMG